MNNTVNLLISEAIENLTNINFPTGTYIRYRSFLRFMVGEEHREGFHIVSLRNMTHLGITSCSMCTKGQVVGKEQRKKQAGARSHAIYNFKILL